MKNPWIKKHINTKNEKGETAYFLAKNQGHPEIMEELHSAVANPDLVPGDQ